MGGTPASQAIVAESQTTTNLGWCPEVDEETPPGKKKDQARSHGIPGARTSERWIMLDQRFGNSGLSDYHSHTGHSRPTIQSEGTMNDANEML